MTIRTSFTAAFVAMMMTVSATMAHATVYTVDREIGDASITGSIETNGTLGDLFYSDVIDWNLQITYLGDVFSLLGPLSGDNSAFGGVGISYHATEEELSWTGTGAVGGVSFCVDLCAYGRVQWDITGNGGSGYLERVQNLPGGTYQSTPFYPVGTKFVIGLADGEPPVSEVPVPAAAWLFGTMLAGYYANTRRKAKK